MLWLKALHIIFVVCWFAGLFYLPRLLVHYAASDNDVVRAQLAMMARKLYRFVTPLMVLAIGFGFGLIALNPIFLQLQWMWLKLAAVIFLVAYHFLCGRYVKTINDGKQIPGHVYFRFFNEVPVLFLFGIVILVVLRPF